MKKHSHQHIDSRTFLSLLTGHSEKEAKMVKHAVTIGCIVNFILMIAKLGVGYWGHSDALVADGFHSLNDFGADILMFLFVGVSYRAADSKFTYGYGKFETFVTLLITTLLAFIAIHIGIEAAERISEYCGGEVLNRPNVWTVWTILFAICVKEFLFRYYKYTGRKADSVALLSSAWHHRADAMASLATLIGVSFAHFLGERWSIMDPIASIVLAVFIMIAAVRMFVPAFGELLEYTPSADVIERAKTTISSTPGVIKLLGIRSRKNGHSFVFDARVAIKPDMTVSEGYVIASKIQSNLIDEFGSNIYVSITTVPNGAESH